MNDKETIIKLAHEAGMVRAGSSSQIVFNDELERFAKLVRDDYSFTHAQLWIKRINDAVAAEREACARIAWNYEPDENGPIETAIRARGEHGK
jgi:hypothetical protein